VAVYLCISVRGIDVFPQGLKSIGEIQMDGFHFGTYNVLEKHYVLNCSFLMGWELMNPHGQAVCRKKSSGTEG